MSSAEILPELVKAVIVTKPQREGWALEEAYDLLILADPSARIATTAFREVLLALSAVSPHEISRIASRMEFSFISRIVPALAALRSRNREEVLEVMRRISGGALAGEMRLRGASKEILRGAPVAKATSGPRLFVEGVDDLFIISFGITKRCGLGCALVVPPSSSRY